MTDNSYHLAHADAPRVERRRLAVAFALMMAAGVWYCGAGAVMAQTEVEIITTGTQGNTSNLQEDREADEAARRIVPAPGTVLQSTEEAVLEGSSAVAPAPSLRIESDQLVVQEGETTESVAVQSGAELLRMLGLQKKERAAGASATDNTADLELNEDEVQALFDVTAVKRLKGDEPTVVYRVVVEDKPLPDPMIVPWIRQAKLLQERFDRAVAMLGENRVDDGRQELLAIVTDFPESEYALQARELLKKLDDLKQSELPAPVAQTEEPEVMVELSPNVSVGTVIVDEADASGNRAMIAGRAYRVGDDIRGEAGHRVISISEKVVQVEVEQNGHKKTFDVPVRPTGTNQ